MLLNLKGALRRLKCERCFQIVKKFSSVSDLEFSDYLNEDHKKLTDFKKYLKSQNLLIKDGYVCLHVACRLCNNSQNQPAYINKTTGKCILLCI